MKILALDSSGLVASVAVVCDDELIAEYTTNYKKTHSETLLPMLDQVTKTIGLDLDTIDALAVASGPGSFTGLRIGSATAKGLGFALDKPIIPVPTLEGLAMNAWGSLGLVVPIMDARRNQVYTGIYSFSKEGSLEIVRDQAPMGIDELVEILNLMGQIVTFLGDGVPVFAEYIEEHLECDYRFAPVSMNRQRAACIASRGASLFAEGKYETAAEHRPEYLRLSQAERERLEAEAEKND